MKSNTYFGYGTEIAVHGLSISNRAYSNAHYKLQDIANRIMDIAKNKDAYLVRGCFNGEQPCGRIFISSSLRSRYGTLFLSLKHQSLIVCTISPYLFLSLSFLLLLLMLLLPVEPGKCAFIHFFFCFKKYISFRVQGVHMCVYHLPKNIWKASAKHTTIFLPFRTSRMTIRIDGIGKWIEIGKIEIDFSSNTI